MTDSSLTGVGGSGLLTGAALALDATTTRVLVRSGGVSADLVNMTSIVDASASTPGFAPIVSDKAAVNG